MKMSLRWLNDHIDVQDYFAKANDLAKLLTAAGLEVEAVENKAEQFRHVVIGHIIKLDRHPNADRLTVCQVDTGEGTIRQIVCGAKNHKAGDKVVVTLPGAVLPGNFEIKKSKIRDVESLGMLASESELGLKDEAEGILILPPDAPVGMPFAEYYKMDDVILEINVSPNRADCLSHLGLAREISTLLNRPLKTVPAKFAPDSSVKTQTLLSLEIRDNKLCPRYSGRVLQSIKVGPSPAWLKSRLESVGLNSINNVVDVTNFVMMDLGQPMHAFDLDQVQGAKIIVDKAPVGEKFKTLDGTELTLKGDELTIRDQNRAICIAGVIGGINSGVTEKTTKVFLESAHFAMDSVRKTARRHGVESDSAYRFSRGTDPSGVLRALDRACELLEQVAGAKVAGDHWDQNATVAGTRSIPVAAEYVGQRLGYPVKAAELEQWLKRLGCKVDGSNGSYKVTPPDYRGDLQNDVDFVEEYGRLNGYEHIPETLPVMGYAPLAHDKFFVFEREVSRLARASGLSQAVNYGFTGSKSQGQILGDVSQFKACGLEMAAEPVRVQNPLNEDIDVMRVSLLPGLVKNLLNGYRYGTSVGRLFETGFVFKKGAQGYEQEPRLGVIGWGVQQNLWSKANNDSVVFFDLKARLQTLLEKLLINVQWRSWSGTVPGLLHPAQVAVLFVEGRNVGFLGSLHPKWLMDEKVRVPAVVGELDLKALSRGQPRVVKFKPVSKFPAVERDLAFVIPKSMAASEVAGEIRKNSGQLLQSVDVFDVFEGGNLPEDHRSVAYRMVFQGNEGTLAEEQLVSLQNQIVAGVQKKLNIKVR